MTIKVLVVEDEPLLRAVAVNLVHDAGFEALEAANGEEALALLETVSNIRVLFTDIEMPKMDGLALAIAVRERWPPIEIIMVSGKPQPEIVALPERSVFFIKPYDVRRLTDTLIRMAV
jgi:CheY-like chemotaxis protein